VTLDAYLEKQLADPEFRRQFMKNARSGSDATLREFEERDLGGDSEFAGTTVVVRPQRATSTSSGTSRKRRR
jgi:hypothetical protein